MANTSIEDKILDREGCLRSAIIFGIIILVLIGIMALVIYLKPQNMMRYGLAVSISKLQTKLGLERTLPDAQYKELKVYLLSAKKFLETEKMNKENIIRVGAVDKVFKSVLADGRITRDEVSEIRAVMWRANIPLEIPKEDKKPK